MVDRKRTIAIIVVSCLILLIVAATAVTIGIVLKGKSRVPSSPRANVTSISTSTKSIQTICQPADYKETCEKSLTLAAGNVTSPRELIKAGLNVGIDELNAAIESSTTLVELAKDPMSNQALQNCRTLLEYSIEDLNKSLEKISAFDMTQVEKFVHDLEIWLSAAITYEQTCLDGFENTTDNTGEKMKKVLKTAMELTSNGLAMVTGISSTLESFKNVSGRRLLSNDRSEVPSWLNDGKHRLLQATPATIRPNVVVAKDGSGKYRTICEALNDVPQKNTKPFVIHIKAGVYQEYVIVNQSLTHVMMIGDGPTKTKITGSKNYVDGIAIFKTATVAIIGSNFIAKDMGFENTAGAVKHQAVALRVQSDMSIFYNCQMDGYQDTLYAHAHRQYYRDCTISGTIDFIFGNAATVFQNCKMIVRKPLENQNCIVTAHGRTERREPTAFILQNCTITADPEYYSVRNMNKAYLGRPWKEYSRTIIMQSQIDDMIQPKGWMPWAGDFALNTCFYAEFGNRGPGAVQTKRVTWRGIKKIAPEQAVKFTPAMFILGDLWIKQTGIPYSSGMMQNLQRETY